MSFSTTFCFPTPEIGFIMNNIFCLVMILIIIEWSIDY